MSDDLDDIQYSNRRKRSARRISESSSDSDSLFRRASRKIRKIAEAKISYRRAFTSSNSSGVSSDESIIHAPSRNGTRRLSSDNGNNDSNDSSSESDVIVRTVKKSSRAVIRSEEESSSSHISIISSSSSTSSSSASSSSSSSNISSATDDTDSFNNLVGRVNSQMRRTRRTVPRVVSDDDESSSSTSDSGTSSPNLPRTRNTRANRTVFSESSSSSSDSPIPRPRRAISRTITAVSETSSESSSEDDDEVAVEENSGSIMEIDPPESEDEILATKKTKPVLPALVTSSDSDDPTAEPCPICLRKLTTQETGTPESCDHSFCLTCLQEWAKNVNTCPVDRQQFSKILVRKTGSDKILRYIQVENVEPVEDIVDDPTACEICGASDREDRLMLCDACNRGYHLECMTPPLDRVPLDEWYCPDCNDNLLLSDESDDLFISDLD